MRNKIDFFSNIVLMIPEVMACTKENSLKGVI